MKIYVIALALLLGGCSFSKDNVRDAPVVTKYKYIVNTVPGEMFVKPDQVQNINTDTATDKDVANWMINSEKRYLEIERRLDSIREYLDSKYNNLKVPPEDVIKN